MIPDLPHRQPDPASLYRARMIHHDGLRLSALDVLALALGWAAVLAAVIGAAVSLLDWLEGRPHEVWYQVLALFEWIDVAGTR